MLGLAAGAACVVALLSPLGASAAVIAVNNTTDGLGDDETCTLREAITAANTNADPFPANGPDCPHDGGAGPDTITLTGGFNSLIANTGEDGNLDGDLDIIPGSGGLTIDGAGPMPTVVGSQGDGRVFHILDSGTGTVTFRDLTIQDGGNVTNGAGILDAARGLTLENVHLEANNTSVNPSNGGGVAFLPSGAATMTVERSTLSNNHTTRTGAGILVGPNGTLNVATTVFDSNEVVDNAPSVSDRGGAIFNQNATTVRDSLFGTNTVQTSDITSATRGGAIANEGVGDTLEVRSTTFIANLAIQQAGSSSGGAIDATAASVEVVNSTFDLNVADLGSAIGQAFTAPTQISAVNSTFVDNPAGAGPGGALRVTGATGVLTLKGSLIENAGADDCAAAGGATITSLGNNVGSDATCNLTATNDLPGQALGPTLESLAPTGGPAIGSDDITAEALTIEPQAASPAFDHIPAASCTDAETTPAPITSDQRGTPRPLGEGCEAGAHEVARCLGDEATMIAPLGEDEVPIAGTAGDDVILAEGGDDTITPGGGNDQVCGGSGADTISFAAANGVTASVNVSNGQGGDSFDSIENLTGSPGKDALTGAAGPNAISGGAGRDTILGLGGNDTLKGQAGKDTLRGGSGRDLLLGGAGIDKLFGQAGKDSLTGGVGKRDLCDGGKGKDRRRARGCELRRKIP